MKSRHLLVGSLLALALVCAGCGPKQGNTSAGNAGSGGSDSGKYCELYANMAANAVHNMDSAFGGSGADHDKIVDDLLKQAPADGSDLRDAAPPDQQKLWDKMATDPDPDTSHAMNVWAQENCPAKYQPVIKSYGKYS